MGFYDFWYNFDSWRVFNYLDEEDSLNAEKYGSARRAPRPIASLRAGHRVPSLALARRAPGSPSSHHVSDFSDALLCSTPCPAVSQPGTAATTSGTSTRRTRSSARSARRRTLCASARSWVRTGSSPCSAYFCGPSAHAHSTRCCLDARTPRHCPLPGPAHAPHQGGGEGAQGAREGEQAPRRQARHARGRRRQGRCARCRRQKGQSLTAGQALSVPRPWTNRCGRRNLCECSRQRRRPPQPSWPLRRLPRRCVSGCLGRAPWPWPLLTRRLCRHAGRRGGEAPARGQEEAAAEGAQDPASHSQGTVQKSVQKSEVPRAGAHGLLAGPPARPPARVQCPPACMPARPPTCMPAHRPLVVSLGTQLPAPGRHGSRECDAGDGARTLRAALRGPGPGGAHGAERVDDQPARDGVEGLHGHRTFAVIVGLGQRERRVAPLTHVCVMI